MTKECLFSQWHKAATWVRGPGPSLEDAFNAGWDARLKETERLQGEIDRIRRLAGEMWGTTGASTALKQIWLEGSPVEPSGEHD